jgi:hypothetical protein
MKKLICTTKTYDYKSKQEAEKDFKKMKKKGYIVNEYYQAEFTYVVTYSKDSLFDSYSK